MAWTQVTPDFTAHKRSWMLMVNFVHEHWWLLRSSCKQWWCVVIWHDPSIKAMMYKDHAVSSGLFQIAFDNSWTIITHSWQKLFQLPHMIIPVQGILETWFLKWCHNITDPLYFEIYHTFTWHAFTLWVITVYLYDVTQADHIHMNDTVICNILCWFLNEIGKTYIFNQFCIISHSSCFWYTDTCST